MSTNNLYNVNIVSEKLLPTPGEVKERALASATAMERVRSSREVVKAILDRRDPRLLLVIGPCSIHDPQSALEYASRITQLSREIGDVFFVVMRTYFEKPRTTVGWKGFINDPGLDDSFRIEQGLIRARELLVKINELGISAGTEALDPITPQYIQDLVTWTAIGARTTESQTHREMASGLSTPVGFKNGTDGSIEIAISALKSVCYPHAFLGINLDGQCAVFQTKGNRYGHIVLRGGAASPNYDSVNVARCEEALRVAGLAANLMIDCSHGNSLKNHALQPRVLEDCVGQILSGNRSIIGFMMESHLSEGSQSIPKDLSQLRYGVSVTDSCLGWEATAESLRRAHERLKGSPRFA